jgi:hypothetical protein
MAYWLYFVINNKYNLAFSEQNRQKPNIIKNFMAPQSKGGQNFKKQTTECYKGQFLNT